MKTSRRVCGCVDALCYAFLFVRPVVPRCLVHVVDGHLAIDVVAVVVGCRQSRSSEDRWVVVLSGPAMKTLK